MDLDQLDAERGGPQYVRVDGETIELPPASALAWRTVVAAATSPHYFAIFVWPQDVRLAGWQIDAAQEAWRVHNGLPEPEQMRRLVYMFERYFDGIEYDLRSKLRVSAGELWRERRWRELLAYIDHLPRDTHMNRLLANDEEYMKAVLRKEKSGTPVRPSMADWSETNSLLATLIDAVNRNTMVTHASAGAKGAPLNLAPEPRPATAAEKVRYENQKKAHEEFVAMLLPGKDAQPG